MEAKECSFSWTCFFSSRIENSDFKGLVQNLVDASDLIKSFQEATFNKFAVWKVTKRNFGSTDFCPDQKFKVYWGENNVPYVILNRKIFDCQHGKDRKEAHKKKMQEEKKLLEEHNLGPSCIQNQTTKKLNCPAQIVVQEILPFEQYKLSNGKVDLRRKISRKLKEDLKKVDCPIPSVSAHLFIVSLPDQSEHKNHIPGPLRDAETVEPTVESIDLINLPLVVEVSEDSEIDILRTNLREKLQKMLDLTYIIQDVNTFKELCDNLVPVLNKFSDSFCKNRKRHMPKAHKIANALTSLPHPSKLLKESSSNLS